MERAQVTSKYRQQISAMKARRESYPTCPWCGVTNYDFGNYRIGNSPELHWGYFWDGPRMALRAGDYTKLWTRKGRIYGGSRRKRKWGDNPSPVRVNEKHWKIVRSGPRLLVACANEFHEDRTK